jgi:hypothetical protein
VNPYAFAWNDPINFADPTGLDVYPYDPGCIDDECNGPEAIVEAAFQFASHALVNAVFGGPSEEDVAMAEIRATYAAPADFAIGAVEGVYDAAAGVATALRHPIRTGEGIYHAVTNPEETAAAIRDAAVNLGRAVASGDFRAIGNAVGQIAASAVGGGAVLSIASKGTAKVGLRVGARATSTATSSASTWGWQKFLPDAAKRIEAAKLKYGDNGLEMMARKADIKQVDKIARDLGLSKDQRRLLHDEITRQDLSIEEIADIARDISQNMPKKGR